MADRGFTIGLGEVLEALGRGVLRRLGIDREQEERIGGGDADSEHASKRGAAPPETARWEPDFEIVSRKIVGRQNDE